MKVFNLFCVKLVVFCFVGSVSGDERVLQNIEELNTSSLLNAIAQLEIKKFKYKYPQFYNPVFGDTHIGFIPQQIQKVKQFPEATIGIVPKRKIQQDLELINMQVINQDALYIANIGVS